jgi:serine/threonine-protein kinase
MIGEALGNYTITAKLGSGTMGVVFRGEHVRIARTAAIKVLIPELTQNASALQRFFTEARATSLIRHPGIVDVYDCDVDAAGRAYIVMEHLDGETLADRLRRTDSIPWATACELARQVADALAAAHASGIVHRDLKPENVFLVRDRADADRVAAVKVLDFGIAKLLAADAPARLTMRWRGRDRRAGRHLCARLHAVRDAERRAAVPGGRDPGVDGRAHVPSRSFDR